MHKICEACGEEFYTLSKQQMYCFDCKQDGGKKARRRKINSSAPAPQKQQYSVTCLICGEPVYYPRRLYCSDECSDKARVRNYIENGDKIRERQRAYYYKNRDRINELARQKRKQAKMIVEDNTVEEKSDMKVDIHDIFFGENIVAPVYVDSNGNYATVIELVKSNEGWLVCRVSQQGDVESLASFLSKERAFEVLKQIAEESDWKMYFYPVECQDMKFSQT